MDLLDQFFLSDFRNIGLNNTMLEKEIYWLFLPIPIIFNRFEFDSCETNHKNVLIVSGASLVSSVPLILFHILLPYRFNELGKITWPEARCGSMAALKFHVISRPKYINCMLKYQSSCNVSHLDHDLNFFFFFNLF